MVQNLSVWYIYIYIGWWFGTFFIVPYIGNFIIPSDELIFFRGVAQPPTSCDIHLVGRSIGFMVCNLWLGGDISYVEELGWVVCCLWFYRRKKDPLPSGKHTKNYWKWWSNGDLTTLNGDLVEMYPLVNQQFANWKMTIEIVDVPMKNADFP